MQIKTVFATASLILVGASAAACSSGSTAAVTTSPASAAGAASSSAATAGTTGAGAPKNFDVCAALPAAAASQITGTTFTKTKPSSVEGVVFNCEYDGPDSALLQITVDTQNGLDQLGVDLSALKTVGHPPAAISGVGDKAYSEPDPRGNAGSAGASSFASYGAVFGADYIKIGGLTYVTAAQGKQIVEQLHSKL
jgi:hypothetical protein